MSLSFRHTVSVFCLAGFVVSLAALTGCERIDATAKSKAPPSTSKRDWNGPRESSEGPAVSKGTRTTIEKNADPSVGDDSSKGAEKIDLTVPTGDTEDLLAHLRKLDAVRLEEDTREAKAEFIQVQKAIIAAADKLLTQQDLKEEARIEAVTLKWNASILLVNLDDEGAEEHFLALANKLVEDKNPAVARTARLQIRQLEIMQSLRALVQGKTKSTEKLMQDLNVILGEEGLRYTQYNLVEQAARILESLEKFDEAAKIYAGMERAFQASGDAELAAQATFRAQQAATRLGWIGKEPELAGTRLDGKSFDLDELKGKVVLVDFWATWCPPCIEELPNVVENYQKYRDRGFEVVGVSLDVDKDALERFVAGENPSKEKLEWVNLFWSEAGESMEANPYENPLAKKFGVDGVPSTFLIDKEGKVISLGVRGERLGEKLAELLGTPDEAPDEDAKPARGE
ncbi:MAG: TlpA disulfide reductase family protein [Pirellulales bacterium]